MPRKEEILIRKVKKKAKKSLTNSKLNQSGVKGLYGIHGNLREIQAVIFRGDKKITDIQKHSPECL